MKATQKSLVGCVFLLLLALICAQAQQNLTPQASQLATAPIILTVTVLNEKGPVIGLQQSDFSVLEEKAPKLIVSFSSQDEPMSIGILFDASSSMGDFYSKSGTKRRIQGCVGALARFLELSDPSNEYFVLGFNTQPQLALNWTSDPKTVIAALGSLAPKGGTALYDACHAGILKVLQGRYRKRAIILISDGEDNASYSKFVDVRKLLMESNILLYSVDVSNGADSGSSIADEGKSILNEFGSISGGKAFFKTADADSKAADVNGVLEYLAIELRHQYTIAIAANSLNGERKWHKIKVSISQQPNAPREMKRLQVRVRKGYY